MSGLVPFIIPIVVAIVAASSPTPARPCPRSHCIRVYARASLVQEYYSNTPFHEGCGKWPPFELIGLFFAEGGRVKSVLPKEPPPPQSPLSTVVPRPWRVPPFVLVPLGTL